MPSVNLYLPFPENVKQKLMEQGLPLQQASVISQITQNLEDGLALNNDEWFVQAQKIVVKLYEVLNQNPMKALLYLQTDWFSHFKEREQLDQGLDLLLLIYKDLLYIQLDKQDFVVFQNIHRSMNLMLFKFTKGDLRTDEFDFGS